MNQTKLLNQNFRDGMQERWDIFIYSLFFKEINHFIQQGCIKLIKNDSKINK